jgi:hypothetical protein
MASEPLQNGEEGYWQLTALYKRNVQLSQSDADKVAKLKASVYSKWDSAYSSNNSHYVFTYYDIELKQTGKVDAIEWSHMGNRKLTHVESYYRISKERGFRIVYKVDLEKGRVDEMVISNIMESGEYDEILDSLRYVYTPAEKF